MADYVQSYAKGFIAREGDKYQYNVGGKVVGTYKSIDELVKDNSGQKKPAEKEDTTFRETLKTKPAKASKKKTSKK
jgi:hypothetical protein